MLNLPKGVTDREIKNMFVFSRGFLKCQIYDQSNNPKNKSEEGCLGAFVLFETPADAAMAQERLDGFIFDSAAPHMTVNCRMAMKNLNISRNEMESLEMSDAKRIRSFPMPHHQQMMPYGQVPGVGMGNVYDGMGGVGQQPGPHHTEQAWDMSGGMGMGGMGQQYAAAAGYGQYAPTPPMQQAPPMQAHAGMYGGGGASRPRNRPAVVGSNNPPCNTLFCSNLEMIDDAEFKAYCGTFAGHAETKSMTDRRGQRVAFVAFHDEAAASEALPSLNNYQGIRVSYSKNPLNQYRS